MDTRSGRRATLMLLGMLLTSATRGEAIQGTYTGSYFHSEGLETENVMRHRYDSWTRDTLPGNVDLRLTMSLSHLSRPGINGSDLLQSRFSGDLSRGIWRARGQWMPWQDVSAGDASPRQRNLNLELGLNPRTLPGMTLHFERYDRESAAGRSTTKDYRAQLFRNFGTVRTHLDYRRLDTEAASRFTAPGRREEWQAGVSTTRRWGDFLGRGSYDALFLDATSGILDTRLVTHRVDLDGTLRLSPELTLGGGALGRWGTSEQSLTSSSIDDRSLRFRAGYRPVAGLDLQLTRDYRRQQSGSLRYLSDYIRFQSTFRRPIRPRIQFQTGFVQTVNLESRNSTSPSSSAHVLVDGRVIAGLEARGELRVSGASGPRVSGVQWRRLAQVRAFPVRGLRMETTWHRETFPEFDGVAQREQQWEFLAGVQVPGGGDITGTYRRLEGDGRILRRDRYGTLNVSWRLGQRGRLSVNGSRREAVGTLSRISERILGADLAFPLPGAFRARTSWRMSRRGGMPDQTQVGVTLTRNF